MSWVTPRAWAAGELVNATMMNEISSSLSYLYSENLARGASISSLQSTVAGIDNTVDFLYALPRWQIQCGGTSVSLTPGAVSYGHTTVVFDEAFATVPHLAGIIGNLGTGVVGVPLFTTPTPSGFELWVEVDRYVEGGAWVDWIAISPTA